MGIKPSALAGWVLFVLLLFFSAFYILAGHLLSLPGAWGARVLVALVELLAYFGGGMLLRFTAKDRSLRRRIRPFPRVYASFAFLTAITAALGVFLLRVGLAHLLEQPYRGISALYPMLTRTATVPPGLSILCLVVLPALVEEFFLRGALFSLYEKQGTAAALLLSTISMPMLYVYPSAAPVTLVLGLVCGLTAYYTGSIWPGVLIQIFCRAALYGGDLLYNTEAFAGKTIFIVVAAGVLFLLFLFSLLRCVEGLLKDELLEHLEKGPARTSENLWNALRTFGFLCFLVLYMIRLVMVL